MAKSSQLFTLICIYKVVVVVVTITIYRFYLPGAISFIVNLIQTVYGIKMLPTFRGKVQKVAQKSNLKILQTYNTLFDTKEAYLN